MKNGVKNIQTAGYNGARTVHIWQNKILTKLHENELLDKQFILIIFVHVVCF